jgi:hypothetical protein
MMGFFGDWQEVKPLPLTDIYHEAHPLHHLTLDEQEAWEEAYDKSSEEGIR